MKPLIHDPKKTDPYCENCYGKASFEALFEMEDMIIGKKYCDACVQGAVLTN
jgi:hypothetical protein